MNNYREILASLLLRMIPACALVAFGWRVLATASGGWGATPRLLLGLGCFVLAVIIVAFPLARLIAEPSGNMFYPGKRASRPSPVYGIPESKRANGLYEEAMEGFEKIAESYPDEVKAYIAMIDISIVNLKDPERANRIFQRGIAALKKNQDKDFLATMYGAIRSRLNAKPSN